jgi:hypothetical protein
MAPRKGSHPSKEARKHMSAARKGWVYSPETRAKISATMHAYRLAHPDFCPARGCKRSEESKARQSAFMRGNKYAYKPDLHMTQDQKQKSFDDYVKLHGEKPHPVVLTRAQIEERLVRPETVQKLVGNSAYPNRKGVIE